MWYKSNSAANVRTVQQPLPTHQRRNSPSLRRLLRNANKPSKTKTKWKFVEKLTRKSVFQCCFSSGESPFAPSAHFPWKKDKSLQEKDGLTREIPKFRMLQIPARIDRKGRSNGWPCFWPTSTRCRWKVATSVTSSTTWRTRSRSTSKPAWNC